MKPKINNLPRKWIIDIVQDLKYNIFLAIKKEFRLAYINSPSIFLWEKSILNSINFVAENNHIYELRNRLDKLFSTIISLKKSTHDSDVIFEYNPISKDYSNSLNSEMYDCLCICKDFKIDDHFTIEELIINIIKIINQLVKDFKYETILIPINYSKVEFKNIKLSTLTNSIDNWLLKKSDYDKPIIVNNFTNFKSSYLCKPIFNDTNKFILKDYSSRLSDIIEYKVDVGNNVYCIIINLYKLFSYIFSFKYVAEIKWLDLTDNEKKILEKKGIKPYGEK